MLVGCGIGVQNDTPVKNICLEEAAHLTGDASSPFCDFSIDYSYLNEKDDSVAVRINRTIQGELFGEDFASLMPEAAVDSFKNTYIRDYREEVGNAYRADVAKASPEDEIPRWYNYTYSLVTSVEEGRHGTVLVTADTFMDTGGAHPNQWSRWLNFSFMDGRLFTIEDVFQPSAQESVRQMLLNSLIRQQAELHPEETITNVEDLQKIGFLQFTDIYIPENFLLGKERMSFLFNRYDIAPYVAGSIVIELPYEEIGAYLNEKELWN